MICLGMRKWTCQKQFTVSFMFYILMSTNVVASKERLERSKKCRYNKSAVKWGMCDPSVHLKTKVAHLIPSKSRSDCKTNRIYTKPCKLKTITLKGCEYYQVSNWSDCDTDTGIKTRTLELKSGATQLCDQTQLDSRDCNFHVDKKKKKKKTDKRIPAGKRNEMKRKKGGKRKGKKKRRKSVTKNGCVYSKSRWKPCNKKTGVQVMKLKLKKKNTAFMCSLTYVVTRKCKAIKKKKKKKKKKNILDPYKESGSRKIGKKSERKKKFGKKSSQNRNKKKKINNRKMLRIPSRLKELRVVPHTDFVTVSWEPLEPSEQAVPVEGYQIGYGRGFPDVHIIRVEGSILSYRIENLEPGREYVISVRAVNKVGVGQALYDTVMTREDRKTGLSPVLPPVGVTAAVLSPQAINVSWVDLASNSQSFTVERSYYLRYRQFNSLSPSKQHNRFRTLHTKNMYLVVSDLLPFTRYEFAVLASSGSSNSSWSLMVWNVTEQDVPGDAPMNLTYILDPDSPRQAVLVWDPPSKPNGVITGYNILCHPSAAEESHGDVTLSIKGNTQSVTLTSLLPGMTYDLSVRANTVKGSGPYKRIQNCTIPEDQAPAAIKLNGTRVKEEASAVKLQSEVPDQPKSDISESLPQASLYPPVNLQALVLSATSVMLTWKDPDFVHLSHSDTDSHTEARKYTVRYRETETETSAYSNLMTPAQSLFAVTLDPDTKYQFSVRVTYKGDNSSWSLPVTNTTFESAPGSAPYNISVAMDNHDPTCVLLSWTPPLQPNGKIMDYSIFYTTNPKLLIRKVSVETVPADILSHRISALKPRRKYYFKMRARNKMGFSPLSPTVVYKTPRVIGKPPHIESIQPHPDNPYNALVKWKPSNSKRIVQYYTLTYHTEDRRDRMVEQMAGDQREAVIRNLQASTTYHFSLQAFYGKGAGPHSHIAKYSIPKELLQNL